MLKSKILTGLSFTTDSIKHILSGYVMADFDVQDFRDHFSKNLVQVLSNENPKMFGEQKFHAKKEGIQKSASKLAILKGYPPAA
jgi:hypothetical protein